MHNDSNQKLKEAEHLEKRREYELAIRAYVSLSDSSDDYAAFWANRNVCYLFRNAGQLDNAIAHGERAWRLEQRLDVGLLLASIYKSKGRFGDALSIIDSLKVKHGDDPDLLVSMGDVVLAMGQPVIEALVCFQRASELAPSHLWARRNYGICLLRLGDSAGAISELTAAIQLSKGDAFLGELADALFENGDLQRSKKIFSDLSSRGPKNAAGLLAHFYDEEISKYFISGWVVSAMDVDCFSVSVGGLPVRIIVTECPNPAARRWEGSEYTYRVGFAAYFESEGVADAVEIRLVDKLGDQTSISVGSLNEFGHVGIRSERCETATGANYLQRAEKLWRQLRFERLIYLLYEEAGFGSNRVRFDPVQVDCAFILARALIHEYRFAEAERICSMLVGARASLTAMQASHAVELYCFARSIRCECTVDTSQTLAFLHAIADEEHNRNGIPGALLNLGHYAALGGRFDEARKYYSAALSSYPGQPLDFNHSVYSFRDAGIEPSVCTLKREALDKFPQAMFFAEVLSQKLDLVHYIACDSRYFERFVPALVSSSARCVDETTFRVGLHVHIVNPTMSNLHVLDELKVKGRYAQLGLSVENLSDNLAENVKHAYYTTPRFLHADLVLNRYKCPVLITETDCILNWTWPQLIHWSKRGQVGLMYKEASRTLALGAKVVAQAVYLDGSVQSLEYIGAVKAYITSNFRFDSKMNWTIDQLALWTAYEYMKKRVSFFNLEREIIKVPDLDKDLFIRQMAATRGTIA